MTRYTGPNGGTFSVTAGVAVTQEYIDAKVKSGEWTLAPDPNETAGKPLDKMTVAELKAYATEHDIDLAEAVNKPDIIAAITLTESAAGDPTAGDKTAGAATPSAQD